MPIYEISFHGRLKGAIGRMCTYREKIAAKDPEEARLKLYEKYQDIHGAYHISEGKN